MKTIVQISQPFREIYLLEIEMESKMINALLQSRTEVRYDFSVLHVANGVIECRLLQLDTFIKEANNDLVREVAEVTAAFNRMFSELHLKISRSGQVIEILNLDLILGKWDQTKLLLRSAAAKNEDLSKLILANDALFTEPSRILAAIQANEFIQVYFGEVFGQELPAGKKVNKMNFFSTTFIDWELWISEKSAAPTQVWVTATAKPLNKPGSDFCKAAYRQFEDKLNLKNLQPALSEESQHVVEKATGRLMEARIVREETAAPELYNKLKFTLLPEKQNREVSAGQEQAVKRNSLILD